MLVAPANTQPTASRRAAAAQTHVRNGALRARVDVVGALAVVVAAGGLVAAALELRTQTAELPTSPTSAIAAPVVRDQWYLDPPTENRAVVPALTVKDRWYEDATNAAAARASSAPVVRDQWYLDEAAPQHGQSPSTPARDRWYLDETANLPAVPRDVVRDRWYGD